MTIAEQLAVRSVSAASIVGVTNSLGTLKRDLGTLGNPAAHVDCKIH